MVNHRQALRWVLNGAVIATIVAVVMGAILLGVFRPGTGKTFASGSGGGGGGGPFPQNLGLYWAGYQAIGPSANDPIHAQVTLPAINCTAHGPSSVSIWVGYDGASVGTSQVSNTVTQDGVNGNCAHAGATPTYALWWEMFGYNRPQFKDQGLSELSSRLQKNDTVDLYVDAPVSACALPLRTGGCGYYGPGAYFSIIAHDSSGAYIGEWSETVAFPVNYSHPLASSECIVERAHSGNGMQVATLPEFYPVVFKDCSVFASGNSVYEDIMVDSAGNTLAYPIITSPYSNPSDITEFQVIGISAA